MESENRNQNLENRSIDYNLCLLKNISERVNLDKIGISLLGILARCRKCEGNNQKCSNYVPQKILFKQYNGK